MTHLLPHLLAGYQVSLSLSFLSLPTPCLHSFLLCTTARRKITVRNRSSLVGSPSTSVASAAQGRRKMWTGEELSYLVNGVKRFGHEWKTILKNYPFNDRSGNDLKDKWRNVTHRGKKRVPIHVVL